MGDERTDLEKVGLFVDGPYDTDVTLFRPDIMALMGRDGPSKEDDPLRLGGPFPVIPGHKLKAATNDWTFSPFLYLWEEEPYTDPGEWRKEYRKEKEAGIIGDGPFVSTVGSKSMNGLGTYYGTFITEMEAFSPEATFDTDDRLKGVPNFLTNPGKKGTGYGYLNVTINPWPEYMGYGYLNVTINPWPEYMEDPAFDALEAHRIMREEFESRLVGGTWIPSGVGKDFFDPNPYRDDRDPDGGVETYDWERLVKPPEPEDRPVWICSNYTKKINGNKDVISPLEKFPEYDPSDPYETVPYNVFRQLTPDPELPSWKPQFGNRSRQVKSVICHNVNLWVNSTNFHMF